MKYIILLVIVVTISVSQCQRILPTGPEVTDEYKDEYGLHVPNEDSIDDGYDDVATQNRKRDAHLDHFLIKQMDGFENFD